MRTTTNLRADYHNAQREFRTELDRLEANRSALRLLREQGALPQEQRSAVTRLKESHQRAETARDRRDRIRRELA